MSTEHLSLVTRPSEKAYEPKSAKSGAELAANRPAYVLSKGVGNEGAVSNLHTLRHMRLEKTGRKRMVALRP